MDVEFGWYPLPLDGVTANIALASLPDLQDSVSGVREEPNVDGDWIYAPRQRTHIMGHGLIERPYSSRVFGLPKTHVLSHANADGREHLDFLVWALSFFVGMRLTTTEAGFLDATPLRPCKLVDFILPRSDIWQAIALAEKFWQANKARPIRAQRLVAALHSLYIAQNPLALQFEQFSYLYGALDTCFALKCDLDSIDNRKISHQGRVSWLCKQFEIPMPSWADATKGPSEVAQIRNPTIHESLFMDEPLGFALHGMDSNRNLTLEMEALICRLVVALLGDPTSEYVKSRVDTRQAYCWSPNC